MHNDCGRRYFRHGNIGGCHLASHKAGRCSENDCKIPVGEMGVTCGVCNLAGCDCGMYHKCRKRRCGVDGNGVAEWPTTVIYDFHRGVLRNLCGMSGNGIGRDFEHISDFIPKGKIAGGTAQCHRGFGTRETGRIALVFYLWISKHVKKRKGRESMEIKEKEKINETYNEYVESITPKANLWTRMAKAFVTGGAICLLGQCILNIGKKYGLDDNTAASYCSMSLVFLSALLTGTGIYPVIASFGGAGALVPITGFANSVAACAHGFKVEGQVFGVGARIFQIAGPVILYGLLTTAGLGLIYWFMGTF